MVKKILLAALALLIILQFFGIDKDNPTVDAQQDFLSVENVNGEIANLIKSACYDCHSNETTYPWYTNIAPLSYWIKGHIDHGREELNFSTWATYSADGKKHKLDESAEKIRKKSMPLKSYTWLHAEARLTDDQRNRLADYFLSLM